MLRSVQIQKRHFHLQQGSASLKDIEKETLIPCGMLSHSVNLADLHILQKATEFAATLDAYV